MKYIIKFSTVLLMLFYISAIAQKISPDFRPNLSNSSNQINQISDFANNWSNNTIKSISTDELNKTAKGSAYYDNKFHSVKINDGVVIKDPLRFNAYTNQMEFLKDDETFEVNKFEGLEVNFTDVNKTYLVKNINGKLIYLLLLVKGKYSLFEYQKIGLHEGTQVNNGLIDNSKYVFSPEKSDFYYAVDDKLVQIKSNEDLLRINDKKEEMADFIKKQKIKTKNSQDLIKFFDYLNH